MADSEAFAGASTACRRWTLGALLLTAVIFGLVRGGHFANVSAGIGFADSYWTQFWLTSYQDGYVRRSLLGSLIALMLAPGTSVAVLSAAQLAITATLLLAGMVIVWRLVQQTQPFRVALLCAAMFGFSPVAPTLFETTGDPLQAALLVWLAGVFLAAHLSETKRLSLLVAVCLAAMLIHEAAAFFILPHLLWTAPRIRALGVKRRTVLVALLIALIAAAIGLLTSDSAGVPRYFLTNTNDHSAIRADALATPGFAQVFYQEMHESFGTSAEALRRVARLMCFPVVPLGLIAFFATFERRLIQLVPLFAIWLVCAAPLFVIAHDWGRFGVLILFAIMATTLADGTRLNLGRVAIWDDDVWQAVTARLMRTPREVLIVRLVISTVVLSSALIWEDYRIVGGRLSLFLGAPALLLAAVFYIRRGRSQAPV